MADKLRTPREIILELVDLVNELHQRLETLELQNLQQRLEQAEELARRRALDLQMQLTRLAEVVADLATR